MSWIQSLYFSGNPAASNPEDDLGCIEGFDDIIPTSDKCYYISSYDDYQTWDDALTICNEMIDWSYDIDYNSQNTQLVSINSNSENNQLYDQLNALQIGSVWIGLSWNGTVENIIRMTLT